MKPEVYGVFIAAPESAHLLPEVSQGEEHPPGLHAHVHGPPSPMLGVAGWLYVIQPGSALQVTAVECVLLSRRPVAASDREAAAAAIDELRSVYRELSKRGMDVL